MPHTLPDLPFAKDALEPHMSQETLEYHYGKHHKTYVDKLNTLLKDESDLAELSLEDLILRSSAGPIFNNAAQIWNHSFFWQCLTPEAQQPPATISNLLVRDFGSLQNFKDEFTKKAVGTFGSGWAWLVKDTAGKISIMTTSNAGTPITEGLIPLLTCDVWEHAYYIDWRNSRPNYLEAFWKLVNWQFVNEQLLAAS